MVENSRKDVVFEVYILVVEMGGRHMVVLEVVNMLLVVYIHMDNRI